MTNTTSQTPQIMTAQEVANLLRVHRCTVTRLAKSGELKSHSIGSRRMFKTEDVWSFFDNQVAWEYVSGQIKEKNGGNC